MSDGLGMLDYHTVYSIDAIEKDRDSLVIMKRYRIRFIFVMIFLISAQAQASATKGPDPSLQTNVTPLLNQTALKKVPDVLVAFDPGDNVAHSIVVEKKTQQIILYAYDGKFEEVYRKKGSTGEAPGAKTRSGDKKTPEGVYFFTKEFVKKHLSPIYGSRAFPMDYPNLLDQRAKKDGYAIWMHGTNKPIKPRDTNGCIALKNDDIDAFAKLIVLNRTPIVVTDEIAYVDVSVQEKVKTTLLRFLTRWKDSVKGTYQDNRQFYDQKYFPEIPWWTWYKQKKRMFVLNPSLSVELKRVSILRHNKIYVALFDKFIKYLDADIFVGTQKLFIAETENKLKIVGEEYQKLSSGLKDSHLKDPVRVAFETLRKRLKTEQKIAYGTKAQPQQGAF